MARARVKTTDSTTRNKSTTDNDLVMQNVHFAYGTHQIINDLTLTVARGEFVCLLGASGAGKSTILGLLTAMLQPDEGTIEVLGQPPSPGRVGYMPQSDSLMPWRTALDNATVALELRGIGRPEARRRALELWETFGLQGAEHRYPSELSGGMRQRVAFLRTVLGGHDVLLLDEPFGALDALTRASMQEWLLDVGQSLGKTVLFVTHDAEEATLLSDRVYVLTTVPSEHVQGNVSSPGASSGVTAVEIEISLPRPRRYSFVTQPEFVTHRRAILEAVGLR